MMVPSTASAGVGTAPPCGDVVGSNAFSLRADRGSACAGRRLLADPVALRAWLLVVIDPLGEPGRTDAIAARVAVERTPDRHAGRGRAHRRARHARGADDPRATPHRRPRATATPSDSTHEHVYLPVSVLVGPDADDPRVRWLRASAEALRVPWSTSGG